MAVRISGHQVKVSNSLRSYIESKLPRIEKYTDRIQSLDIVVEKDGPQHTVELRLKAGPMEVTTKQKDPDPHRAVDLLMDKAERALRKQHDKMIGKDKHKKVAGREVKKANLSPDAEPLPLIETEGPSLGNGHAKIEERDMPVIHEKLNIRIFNSPKATSGRMTVQQAAEELYFKDENFLCFNNAETESVSILYRRKDGNFAIMHPEGN